MFLLLNRVILNIMDANTLKKIVEEVVTKAVEPIKEQLNGIVNRLDDPDTGLVAINSRLDDSETGLVAINNRLDANTGAIMNLEKTVKGYADSYKINDSNIRRMEKRVETLEDKAGVDVPEEFHLAAMADI